MVVAGEKGGQGQAGEDQGNFWDGSSGNTNVS